MENEIREALNAVRGAKRDLKAMAEAEDKLNLALGIVASIPQFEKQRDDLKGKIAKFQEEKNAIEEAVGKANTQIHEVTRRLGETKSFCEKQEATIKDQLRKALEVEEVAMKEQLARLKEGHEQERDRMATERANTQAEIGRLNAERDHLRNVLDQAARSA